MAAITRYEKILENELDMMSTPWIGLNIYMLLNQPRFKFYALDIKSFQNL